MSASTSKLSVSGVNCPDDERDSSTAVVCDGVFTGNMLTMSLCLVIVAIVKVLVQYDKAETSIKMCGRDFVLPHSQLGSEFYASSIHVGFEDRKFPQSIVTSSMGQSGLDHGCLEQEHGSMCFGTAPKPTKGAY